jgi:alkanesulfonate monooxygenase
MEPIDVFTTCPPSYNRSDAAAYLKHVCDVSRWSDEAGCKGMLIYTDNNMVDPWLLAQVVVQNTRSLMPLVAVQPVYMHPFAVAKEVSTLSYLYGRRIALNMVAGGFKNDLTALNDTTPHDRRYDRLVEYTTIIQRLLAGAAPVTFEGEFYCVRQLVLKPPLPAELMPLITISGSSAEGLAAARALNAIPVMYPEPADRCSADPLERDQGCGVRVGIIARPDEDDAWQVAYERFPPDRAGQIAHSLAMKVSDSSWHRQLSDLAAKTKGTRDTYWLVPFEQYKTFCPYLVGSYSQVAHEVGRYVGSGVGLFILDVPASGEELDHISRVMSRASRRVSA